MEVNKLRFREKGKREVTNSTIIGRSTLGERGGVLELLYVVDFDHACANRNQLKITVREQ